MNKLFTHLSLHAGILSLTTLSIIAQTTTPNKAKSPEFHIGVKVDRRVELLSIVARLAGFDEYSNGSAKKYTDDIDRYFEKYKQHPLILYTKGLRKDHNVGYDAVMKMAVHLSQPPELAPRVAFDNDLPDPRWGGKRSADQFVKLLQQFYKDADCENFFESHKEIYAVVEQRFQQQVNKVDLDWYRKFFGELPFGNFSLYVYLNGTGNYAPAVVFPSQKKDAYAIIGTSQVDDAGLPVYQERQLATVIHEFTHTFIDYLVVAHEQELRPAGEKIYESVSPRVRIFGFNNWENVLIESLVRASVVRYRLAHEADPEVAFRQLTMERNYGLIWMEDLETLLGSYENCREQYPKFSSVFPLIVGYFKDLSNNIGRVTRIFDQRSPHVIDMSPFANNSQDVDPNVTKLVFTFDKPLDVQVPFPIHRSSIGAPDDPIVKAIGYDESGTTFTLELKLSPDQQYEFLLTGVVFRSKDGYPLKPYTVKFKTRRSSP